MQIRSRSLDRLRALQRMARVAEQAAEVLWEPYQIPGVMVGTLYVDTDKREIACFVRAQKGVRFPKHLHLKYLLSN